jgi:signal transduction histidine kinase
LLSGGSLLSKSRGYDVTGSIRHSAPRYLGALLVVGAAGLLTHLLSNLGDSGISPLFFAAVLISAWYGGRGPGLMATAASGLATAYILIPNVASLAGVRDVIMRVVVFTVVALLASALNAATKRAAEAFRKARDSAEEASAAKSRFLAIVSHELRTPLSSVTILADGLAADRSLPPAAREDAVKILESVELEARLIDDLVDLSSISSGKLRLNRGLVDLHESLLAAIKSCETSINDKAIHLVEDLAAEHRNIIGDRTRLQQVFWNLIRNAIKFTPDGGRVAIRTWNDATQTFVEVSDNGIGIDPQRLVSIFRAFEQGNADIPARFGGLGLGLAICQALVEAHGGRITAASDGPGTGARFRVSFETASDPNALASTQGPAPAREHPVPNA